MKDYRMNFIRDLETELSSVMDAAQVAMISNITTKILSGYEITERCTDLVPVDDLNGKLIRRYKACLLMDGKSPKTIYQYERTCKRLSETINKPFTDMGTYDVRFYLALEKDRGVSNITLENTRANISAFFQWLTNEEVIPKNPVARITPIKCVKEVKKVFSDVEIDALRSACRSKKERALVEFLLSSGVRVSELANMEVQDINFSDLSVHVRHGKGNKERLTYITSVSAKHLIEYYNERKEKGNAVFYNQQHEPIEPGGIRVVLHTIASRTNVENVHPHRFRRTFATNLAKRGMDVQNIQKLMGHSDINTTMRYIYIEDSNVKSAYKKFIA